VSVDNPKWQASASAMGVGTSHTQWIANGNHSLTFVIEPSGTLTGSVERKTEGLVLAKSTTRVNAMALARVSNGLYNLELPVGIYDIRVVQSGRSYGAVRAEITQGATTVADFALR
jgi:hypothetical protein